MQLKIAASRRRKIEHVHFVEMTQAQHKSRIDAAPTQLKIGLRLCWVEKTQHRWSINAIVKAALSNTCISMEAFTQLAVRHGKYR
jgi:hypothetical protein